MMQLLVPYLAVKNPDVYHSVNFLLTNNNHFDTLKPKDKSSALSYSKIKKKISKRKKKLKS